MPTAWDAWLPCAVLAIDSAASTPGGELTLPFIDRGQHPGPALSLPDLPPAGRRRTIGGIRDSLEPEREVRAAARGASGAQGGAGPGPGRRRLDATLQVGNQVLLRAKELLDAAEVGKLLPL